MGYLILFILNLFAPLAALGVVIFFLISPRRKLLRNLRYELGQRFVLARQGQKIKKSLWIHAASVGEVRSVVKLAKLLKDYYGCELIITTSTAAGRNTALKEPVFDKALLMPVDCYPLIKRFIGFYNPKYLFIVESDLWPNMIAACANNGVKVSIVNGRLSERSARRYKIISPLVKMLLGKITFICAQTEEIAQRYIFCGASADKVYSCGNIKYDLLNESPSKTEEVQEVFAALGWEKDFITVCGSTHEEEENIIISAAKELKDIKFVIAPRHLERKKQILHTLRESGLKYVSLSSYRREGDLKGRQILLADAMGWLGAFYKKGTVCFVGGSISKCGGHNFLEAAVFAKPVLFGQYYYNTPDVAAALLKGGGGILVGADDFAKKLKDLFDNRALLAESGAAAGECSLSFKGATERTLKVVEKYGK